MELLVRRTRHLIWYFIFEGPCTASRNHFVHDFSIQTVIQQFGIMIQRDVVKFSILPSFSLTMYLSHCIRVQHCYDS